MGLMQKIKNWIKYSDSILAKFLYESIKLFFRSLTWIEFHLKVLLFYVFWIFPLQDKVVGSNFSGKRYGDNTKAIYEYLRSKDDGIQLVWVVRRPYQYPLPPEIKRIDRDNVFSVAYHYATAKVWVDTHVILPWIQKRKGQMFIETWHGGLGIKKIFNNRNDAAKIPYELFEVDHMNRLADLFVSNSDHISRVYRNAIGYTGPIWRCGYPKNDRLFLDPANARKRVREQLSIPQDAKIAIYAPTFRGLEMTGDPHDVAVREVVRALGDRFGGEWYFFIRLHPITIRDRLGAFPSDEAIRDVTDYPDFQELVLACDAFLSDYSSGIFDAALLEKPCFVYAKDFEEYKAKNGVYYELDELPFPYAFTNESLIGNIEHYDHELFLEKWSAFMERVGLYETGHATEEIGQLITAYIHGDPQKLEDIKHECES